MPHLIVRHTYPDGILRAVGRANLDLNPFTLRVTKPTTANVGANTTLRPLTPVYGDITVTTPNYDLSGLDVFGLVKVRAAGCHGTNFRVRGSVVTNNTAMIDCNHVAASGANFSQVTLIPDNPSRWTNSVIGHDYTVTRGLMLRGTDGAGMYNAAAPSAACNTALYGCLIGQLMYVSPDIENHSDNRTHNDGVQIQGNTGHTIVGSTIVAMYDPVVSIGVTDGPAPVPTYYRPSVTGQAIGITPNVSLVDGVVIEDNWLDAGAQSITVIAGSQGVGTNVSIKRNRFGRNQPLLTKGGVSARRAILIQDTLSIPGMPSATDVDTVNGNVYEDDGSPVTIHRLPAASI
jgi:hypothetical protein